jgi:hypothetical protein
VAIKVEPMSEAETEAAAPAQADAARRSAPGITPPRVPLNLTAAAEARQRSAAMQLFRPARVPDELPRLIREEVAAQLEVQLPLAIERAVSAAVSQLKSEVERLLEAARSAEEAEQPVLPRF